MAMKDALNAIAFFRKPQRSTTRRAAQAAATLFVRGRATAACLIVGMCAANAQASRTWVSGTGIDHDPCTRLAPCTTFAAAIAQTAAGGEINAIDGGDFGPLTITKALTIDGGGGQVASVTVASGDAITVQAGPNDVVTLRNLRINGTGSGLYGIRFVSGAAIHIQNCYISGFQDYGIHITNVGTTYAYISDTVVSNTVGGGIHLDAQGGIWATLLRVQMRNSLNFGLEALNAHVAVTDSQASNNQIGIFVNGADVIINRSAVVNNFSEGIVMWSSGKVIVGNSTIAGNGTGVDATPGATQGGTILTNENNSLIGNFISNGTFSAPAPLK
jgi:Right handed beta helix region